MATCNSIPDGNSTEKKNRKKYDDLQILLDHKGFVVVNKPCSMFVHQSVVTRKAANINKKKIGYINDILKSQLNLNKLYPVHRLDFQTTGCLIFAKTSNWVNILSSSLHVGQKTYVACVSGDAITGLSSSSLENNSKISMIVPESSDEFIESEDKNTISMKKPLFTHKYGGRKKKKLEKQESHTIITPIASESDELQERDFILSEESKEQNNDKEDNDNTNDIKLKRKIINISTSLIIAQPRTGRTHQIRKHCVSLNIPLIGDTEYCNHYTNRYWREQLQNSTNQSFAVNTDNDNNSKSIENTSEDLFRLMLHCIALEIPIPSDEEYDNLPFPKVTNNLARTFSEKAIILAPLPQKLFDCWSNFSWWNDAVNKLPCLSISQPLSTVLPRDEPLSNELARLFPKQYTPIAEYQ